MNHLTKIRLIKLFQVALVLLVMPGLICAQSLESKLSQKGDFVPTSTSVIEQLTEVAQHYKIPMGIEWIHQSDERNISSRPLKAQRTVREMINLILQQAPNYKVKAADGALHIAHNSFAEDSNNFLNIRIPDYQAQEDNLFGAEALLRFMIRRTLHPEQYKNGFNGGYGYGVPREDNFDVRNISFSGHNLTVRDILNKIVAINGNALWLVELTPLKMMTGEPFFAQGTLNEDGLSQPDFHWRIIPLGKVKGYVKYSKVTGEPL